MSKAEQLINQLLSGVAEELIQELGPGMLGVWLSPSGKVYDVRQGDYKDPGFKGKGEHHVFVEKHHDLFGMTEYEGRIYRYANRDSIEKAFSKDHPIPKDELGRPDYDKHRKEKYKIYKRIRRKPTEDGWIQVNGYRSHVAIRLRGFDKKKLRYLQKYLMGTAYSRSKSTTVLILNDKPGVNNQLYSGVPMQEFFVARSLRDLAAYQG